MESILIVAKIDYVSFETRKNRNEVGSIHLDFR